MQLRFMASGDVQCASSSAATSDASHVRSAISGASSASGSAPVGLLRSALRAGPSQVKPTSAEAFIDSLKRKSTQHSLGSLIQRVTSLRGTAAGASQSPLDCMEVISAAIRAGFCSSADFDNLGTDEIMMAIGLPDSSLPFVRTVKELAGLDERCAKQARVESLVRVCRPPLAVVVPIPTVRRTSTMIVHSATGCSVTSWKVLDPGIGPIQPARDYLLDVIWALYVALGNETLRPSEAVMSAKDDVKESFLRQFADMDAKRLAAYVSGLKRWAVFYAAHGDGSQPFWKPSAATLVKWLTALSKYPTAPAGALAKLKWWREKLGVPFPFDDPVLAAWFRPCVNHVVKQQAPLAIVVFFRLLDLAGGGGTVGLFCKYTLLLLVMCLRFAHLQRSARLRRDGPWLRGTCLMGKRRVGWQRPPFDWAGPDCLVQGQSLFAEVLVVCGEMSGAVTGELFWVIPDMVITKGVLDRSSPLLPRPMSLPKFIQILQALLKSMGMSDVEVRMFTSYALRRFLPSAADVLRCSTEEKQMIGNWQEVVSTAAAAKEDRAQQSMHARYADDKVGTAADIKARVLLGLAKVRTERGSPDFQWQAIRDSRVTWASLASATLPTGPAYKTELKLEAVADEAQETESEGMVALDEESSSEEELNALTTDNIAWFRQGGCKIHLVQDVSETMFIPWCRDTTFAQQHSERGTGLEKEMSICRKCVARSSERVHEAIVALGLDS
jgi:hypothetical protein